MTQEKLIDAITDLDSDILNRYFDMKADLASKKKPRKRTWVKWASLAACFAIAIMIAIPFINKTNNPNINAGVFGNGDTSLFESHRGDFTPKIEDSILTQFENNDEIKKVYLLRTNDWFLSDDLADFSQVVSTDIVYIVPGGEKGENIDTTYTLYYANNDKKIEYVGSSSVSNKVNLPYGFVGLTYEIIDNALNGISYNDYVITYSNRLSTVFVWVRGEAEDVIITYSMRPDFLGLENGGRYKLDDLKAILEESYKKATE